MTMPDRIWAAHNETRGAVMIGEWADTVRHLDGTEYVRADLMQELIDAYADIIDYALVFAKKPQWDRLKAAKEKMP